MCTLAVFNEHKVPIELGISCKTTHLVQLRIGVFSAINSSRELLCKVYESVADFVRALFNIGLKLLYLRNEVGVAL